MVANLSAISEKIIIMAIIKNVPKIFKNDFEYFSLSVFNSNFIIQLYAEDT